MTIAVDASVVVAALAHRDLLDLSVVRYPFEPLADRVWELHPTVTAYDAAFVALAEDLDVRAVDPRPPSRRRIRPAMRVSHAPGVARPLAGEGGTGRPWP